LVLLGMFYRASDPPKLDKPLTRPPMHKYTKKGSVLVFDGETDTAENRAEKLSRVAARRAELDSDAIARVAVRRARKGPINAKSSDELQLDTLEVKVVPPTASETSLKLRSHCLRVGKSLVARGTSENGLNVLAKAGRKIQNCRIMGLFQEVAPDVHYKIGAALCKQKLCPNCQRVLSAKRKENISNWFVLNRQALRKYFFYHMVLTVPHDAAENLRTGLYVSELLESFSRLRGASNEVGSVKRKRDRDWWNSWVSGGFYHVENKMGVDSPHIHLHIIVAGKKKLFNAAQSSVFKTECSERWATLTDNQSLLKGFFIEPVYVIDPETKQRINCAMGSNVHIEAAVSEASKYTMKTDSETLGKFSDNFLADMLLARNRYYGRFGSFTAQENKKTGEFQQIELLRTDFKDLEQVRQTEYKRLLNPETGEMVEKEDTRLLVTPFRNMRATDSPAWVDGDMSRGRKERRAGEKIIVGEMVYKLEPQVPIAIYYEHFDRGRAVARMGSSLGNSYDPTLDIL
jgi:hypothetical protein